MSYYYKKLDWNSSLIQSQLLEYCVEQGHTLAPIVQAFIPIDSDAVLAKCPALVEFFQITGFTVLAMSLYTVEKLQTGIIHVDNIKDVRARINFPVLNPHNADTVFYKVKPKSIIYKKLGNGVDFYKCIDPNPIEVDRVTITAPTVLNVHEPHNVLLKQEGLRRIALTVKVHPDPYYLMDKTNVN